LFRESSRTARRRTCPQTAPRSAPRVPQNLRADDLFVGLISLTDNTEILYLEAAAISFFTAISAAVRSVKRAITVPVFSILFSFEEALRRACYARALCCAGVTSTVIARATTRLRLEVMSGSPSRAVRSFAFRASRYPPKDHPERHHRHGDQGNYQLHFVSSVVAPTVGALGRPPGDVRLRRRDALFSLVG
jgi:hypothetical protein